MENIKFGIRITGGQLAEWNVEMKLSGNFNLNDSWRFLMSSMKTRWFQIQENEMLGVWILIFLLNG